MFEGLMAPLVAVLVVVSVGGLSLVVWGFFKSSHRGAVVAELGSALLSAGSVGLVLTLLAGEIARLQADASQRLEVRQSLELQVITNEDVSRLLLDGLALDGFFVRERTAAQISAVGASLNASTWEGSDLTDADFSTAELRASNLTAVRAVRADFQSAVLQDAQLIESTIAMSNFNDSDMSGVQATGSCFAGSTFAGAILMGADLSGARFVNALMLDADLTGADLSGADLRGANLRGSSISAASSTLWVTYSLDTRLPVGFEVPSSWQLERTETSPC